MAPLSFVSTIHSRTASERAVYMLARDDRAEYRRCYLRVIKLVEGDELGREMILIAARNEQNAEKRAQLNEAAAKLAKRADGR